MKLVRRIDTRKTISLDSRTVFLIFVVVLVNISYDLLKHQVKPPDMSAGEMAQIDALDELESADDLDFVEKFEEDEQLSLPADHFVRGTVVYKKAAYSDDYDLYLMNKASRYITTASERRRFRSKVIEISERLDIEPSWLMAVMYTESRFDTRVKNARGSGATGLIQWMPETLKGDGYGMNTDQLSKLSHVQQLDLVYRYLSKVQKTYGKFENLTETYLAVLRPKTLENKDDFCSILFQKGTKSYGQNSDLDKNKDGLITISDIDKHMQNLYTTAYFRKPYEFVGTIRSMKNSG